MSRIKLAVLMAAALILPTGSLFSQGTKEAPARRDLTFLYVPGVADPFYYTMEKGAVEKAEELGIRLVVSEYPLVWDPAVQIPVLKEAAGREAFDLILIAPTANDALIAPLKSLYEQGREIITVDTKIGDGDYSVENGWSFPLSHIGTDNFAGGVRIAEYMAEQVREKGKVYINTTTRETSTTEERKDGFVEGISRFPDMEVVRIDYNGDIQTLAMKQTLKAMQEFPDLVGIFGSNVFSSQGVSAAVTNAGLSGAVRVAAWDATKALVAGLRNGEIDLVLAQKPAEIGALAVEWGYRYFAEGKAVPEKITSGYVLLTQSNLNDPEMKQYVYSR